MTMTQAIALIHIVEDDPSVARALKRLLCAAQHPCETYPSAEAFMARAAFDRPGCVIIDLQLPGIGGLALQAHIAEQDEVLPVIFLTGRGNIETGVQAMKGGAVDFLTKPVEPDLLFAAVAVALERGQTERLARREKVDHGNRLARLTPREREVLDRVVEGLLNKQIAAELGIAEKTVKVHRARVMQKLEVRTIAGLVRLVADFVR